MLFKRKTQENVSQKFDVEVKYAKWDDVVRSIRAEDYYYGWFTHIEGVIPEELKKRLENSRHNHFQISTYVEDGKLYTLITW